MAVAELKHILYNFAYVLIRNAIHERYFLYAKTEILHEHASHEACHPLHPQLFHPRLQFYEVHLVAFFSEESAEFYYLFETYSLVKDVSYYSYHDEKQQQGGWQNLNLCAFYEDVR